MLLTIGDAHCAVRRPPCWAADYRSARRAGHGVGRFGAMGMPGHGLQEIFAFQGVEQRVGPGGDRRSARYLPEQGYLTEEVPLFQGGHPAAVLGHRYFAAHYDVEAVSRVSLAHDLGS